jgi:hypothetical protein
MKLALTTFALAVSLTISIRADVLTVGPSGQMFTTPQAAVNAALDDDVVLIRPGAYFSFTIDGKALTVVGGPSVSMRPPLTIRNLSASQTVTISAVGIAGIAADPAQPGIAIENCAGPVRVQNCLIRSIDTEPAARVAASPQVSFARCTLSGAAGFYNDFDPVGPGPGLVVTNSTVALYSTDVLGGDGGAGGYGSGGAVQRPAFDGTHGCSAGPGAQVFMMSGELRGGRGGDGASASCAPVVFAGGAARNGGDGLVVDATAHVDLLDVDAVAPGTAGNPGPGNVSCAQPAGANGTPGTAISGATANVTSINALRRGLSGTATVRELHDATLTFTGTPGDVVLLAWSAQPRHEFFAPFNGVITYGTPLRRLPMGTIPGSGTLTVVLPIAELGPGVQASKRCLQAVFRDVSGQVVLSDPMTLVLLDAAY